MRCIEDGRGTPGPPVESDCPACAAGIYATMGWLGSCGHTHRQIIATTPDGELVDLDASLSEIVHAIWHLGIRTASSCQGDANAPAFVLLERGTPKSQAEAAAALIPCAAAHWREGYGDWIVEWGADVTFPVSTAPPHEVWA